MPDRRKAINENQYWLSSLTPKYGSLGFSELALRGLVTSWFELTHCGRVTHISVGKLVIIGSDNGLSPDRRQAIIGTNVRLLSIRLLRKYFNENSIKIQQFSLKKMHVKKSSAKWRPSCLGLTVLKCGQVQSIIHVMRCRLCMVKLQYKLHTSNGSWCIGIKGEMSGTVCVTFTWDIYIYIWVVYSFCLFCCLFIIVTWWYIWCIVWQVASKRKYRHVW